MPDVPAMKESPATKWSPGDKGVIQTKPGLWSNNSTRSISMVVFQIRPTPNYTSPVHSHHPSMLYRSLMASIASGVFKDRFCNPGALPRAALYDPFRVFYVVDKIANVTVVLNRNDRILNSCHISAETKGMKPFIPYSSYGIRYSSSSFSVKCSLYQSNTVSHWW